MRLSVCIYAKLWKGPCALVQMCTNLIVHIVQKYLVLRPSVRPSVHSISILMLEALNHLTFFEIKLI